MLSFQKSVSIKNLYSGDLWGSVFANPRLLKTMLDTANIRWLWPLQELSGTAARDFTGNGRSGTYDGLTLNMLGPNARVDAVAKYDGVNDKIDAAAGCSVRGLAAITWVGVVNITTAGADRCLWFESVGNAAGTPRLYIFLQADGTIKAVARSGLAAQAASVKTTDAAPSTGLCMLHVTVDVPNDAITISRNGAALAATGVPDFGVDTIFADTAPLAGPQSGYYLPATVQWYDGSSAYLGLYSGVMAQATMLAQAQAGGFA